MHPVCIWIGLEVEDTRRGQWKLGSSQENWAGSVFFSSLMWLSLWQEDLMPYWRHYTACCVISLKAGSLDRSMQFDIKLVIVQQGVLNWAKHCSGSSDGWGILHNVLHLCSSQPSICSLFVVVNGFHYCSNIIQFPVVMFEQLILKDHRSVFTEQCPWSRFCELIQINAARGHATVKCKKVNEQNRGHQTAQTRIRLGSEWEMISGDLGGFILAVSHAFCQYTEQR